MSDQLRFTNLDTIVRDVCFMIGDEEYKQYVRVARLGRDVLAELNLLALPFYKSDFYTIGANYTVALPSDCVKITKVGTLDNLGRITLFGEEPRLRIQKEAELMNPVSCDNPDLDQNTMEDFIDIDISVGLLAYYNLNSRGAYIGELFGLRNRKFKNGVYRYDKELNIVEFGYGTEIYDGAKVLIEYKSAVGEDGLRLVPVEWKMPIVYRILQHLDAYKRPGVSQTHFRQFQREFTAVKRLAQSKPLKEWTSAIEEARYSTPKW